MSRLLINEPPLQVLPSLAEAIGLNEAIFLQQLHFLSLHQRLRDGRRWYSTRVEDWMATFKFWSKRTIERIISSLRRMHLLDTTDAYNQESDDRTLWYAINYNVLDELEFDVTRVTEKSAPSGVRQYGGVRQDAAQQEGNPKNPRPVESANMAERPRMAREITGDRSANMADSSFLRNKPTTTPGELDAKALQVLTDGGVDGEFKLWIEALGLKAGPGLNLTLNQWVAWVEAGLQSQLKAAATNVILMGTRATDPSAVLRARMERHVTALQNVPRPGAPAAEPQAACKPGERRVDPKGGTWTVEVVEHGRVIFEETHAPLDQFDAIVATWPLAALEATA